MRRIDPIGEKRKPRNLHEVRGQEALEHIPISWNRRIERDSLHIDMLAHVLTEKVV